MIKFTCTTSAVFAGNTIDTIQCSLCREHHRQFVTISISHQVAGDFRPPRASGVLLRPTKLIGIGNRTMTTESNKNGNTTPHLWTQDTRR